MAAPARAAGGRCDRPGTSRPGGCCPSFESLLAREGLAWMGQNTTHLEPPDEVVAALSDSTRRREFQLYAPALGFEHLRELILDDLGLAGTGAVAMITDGAVAGLHHVCTALAAGLSRLVTTDPGWPWPARFVGFAGVLAIRGPGLRARAGLPAGRGPTRRGHRAALADLPHRPAEPAGQLVRPRRAGGDRRPRPRQRLPDRARLHLPPLRAGPHPRRQPVPGGHAHHLQLFQVAGAGRAARRRSRRAARPDERADRGPANPLGPASRRSGRRSPGWR